MLKIKKLKVFYIVIFVLVLQFLINLDPFVFSSVFANNVVIRYFPFTIMFSLSLYKSKILNKITAKSSKILVSFLIGIIFSVILSLFKINWYTYKVVLTDFTICLCLYMILRNKFSNIQSIIPTVIFGLLYFLILNQATEYYNPLIDIDEHSQIIMNIALISTAILFVNDIEDFSKINIIISVVVIIIFYIANMIYAISVKSKIDDIDTTYNTLIQAVIQNESSEKIRDILNIYPNFPKIGPDQGGSFSLAKPEGPYISIQIFYKYALTKSITFSIEAMEYAISNNDKDLQAISSTLYDNLVNSDSIEIIKQAPLKCFSIDFICNLLLIILIIIYQKLKYHN